MKTTFNVKHSELAKEDQTIKKDKLFKFKKNGKGTITYTLSSAKNGKKSVKNSFSINKTSGKLTIKKGLKTGSYTVKVKIAAKGNKNYNSATKTVEFTVKVK